MEVMHRPGAAADGDAVDGDYGVGGFGGLQELRDLNKPVIAAVNGTAAGAGMSLVMACDLAVAAESAVFTMAYTRAGLVPDGSSTFFMPRRIGDRRARGGSEVAGSGTQSGDWGSMVFCRIQCPIPSGPCCSSWFRAG